MPPGAGPGAEDLERGGQWKKESQLSDKANDAVGNSLLELDVTDKLVIPKMFTKKTSATQEEDNPRAESTECPPRYWWPKCWVCERPV